MSKPVLQYESEQPQRSPEKLRASLLVAALLLAAWGWLWFGGSTNKSMSRARPTVYRVKCSGQMRQLGQLIRQYANANDGNLPDTLATLARATPDFDTTLLVCPNDSSARPAKGVVDLLQSLDSSDPKLRTRNCSYIYLGAGLTVQELDENVVILAEPVKCHEGVGGNMLTGDDYAEFLQISQIQSQPNTVDRIYAAIAAGARQIRFPSTRASGFTKAPTSSPARGN